MGMSDRIKIGLFLLNHCQGFRSRLRSFPCSAKSSRPGACTWPHYSANWQTTCVSRVGSPWTYKSLPCLRHRKFMALCMNKRLGGLNGVRDDLRQRHPLPPQLHLASGNPRHVQQIIDQTDQVAGSVPPSCRESAWPVPRSAARFAERQSHCGLVPAGFGVHGRASPRTRP